MIPWRLPRPRPQALWGLPGPSLRTPWPHPLVCAGWVGKGRLFLAGSGGPPGGQVIEMASAVFVERFRSLEVSCCAVSLAVPSPGWVQHGNYFSERKGKLTPAVSMSALPEHRAGLVGLVAAQMLIFFNVKSYHLEKNLFSSTSLDLTWTAALIWETCSSEKSESI